MHKKLTTDLHLGNCAVQKRGGRQGSDIIGVTRIALNRIPMHDDAALAALAQQQAVSQNILPLPPPPAPAPIPPPPLPSPPGPFKGTLSFPAGSLTCIKTWTPVNVR